MKFASMPKAAVRPGDGPKMQEAIRVLEEHRWHARRPSEWQLKLNPTTSYYPTKGTLFVDQETGPRPERGIEALKAWLVTQSLTLDF